MIERKVANDIQELRAIKSRWRDQIALDKKLGHAAFRVGYVMADAITLDESVKKFRTHGKVILWPSQMQIHLKTGISRSTIGRGIVELIQRGHLRRLKQGNQQTGTNKYRLIFPERQTAG